MLQRDLAVLAVIDFQDNLLPKVPVADAIIAQTVRLIHFAKELDLPILWSEQYKKGLGPTNPVVAEQLQELTPLEKTSFGCLADPGIDGVLTRWGRHQLLLTGIEAHICVMQTALQALEKGYEVYVVRDAVASRRKSEYKAGLARMQQAGARLVTTEMAMFEILGRAATPEFKKVLPLLKGDA